MLFLKYAYTSAYVCVRVCVWVCLSRIIVSVGNKTLNCAVHAIALNIFNYNDFIYLFIYLSAIYLKR